MSITDTSAATHSHVFLGEGHERNERRTWMVIALCAVMMIAEIVGGLLFGSIALVADGLHMSTHASALLLAALAYNYARRHANDDRFSFGTGKLGDLAGFSSAIILAMIALLIGYEAVTRLIWPVAISFNEAIPIAVLGLAVNVASVLLLSGGGHHHGHSHAAQDLDHDHDEVQTLQTADGSADARNIRTRRAAALSALGRRQDQPRAMSASKQSAPTARAKCSRMVRAAAISNLIDEIPEPHAFTVRLSVGNATHAMEFAEHEHSGGNAHRDNNMRAAIVHVLADAAVSVLVILGLLLGRFLGWGWMDPVVGLCGAVVIAVWSYGLIRDTGAVLLDMNPDRNMAERMRALIETDGDRLTDLHLWRLGPGHLGAILSVATPRPRGPDYYQSLLSRFRALSHVTVQVQQQ